MWGNIVAKQKPWGEHCNNPQCFKEKNYEAKSTKTILEKKRKKFIKKKAMQRNIVVFHNVFLKNLQNYIFNHLNIKKKSRKIILKKNTKTKKNKKTKKRKKNM